MTIEDFERAKVIQHKANIASNNLDILERIENDAYSHPFSQPSYKIKVNDNPKLEMLVNLDFIEMAIEYYRQEVEKLNEQFAALGKD